MIARLDDKHFVVAGGTATTHVRRQVEEADTRRLQFLKQARLCFTGESPGVARERITRTLHEREFPQNLFVRLAGCVSKRVASPPTQEQQAGVGRGVKNLLCSKIDNLCNGALLTQRSAKAKAVIPPS